MATETGSVDVLGRSLKYTENRDKQALSRIQYKDSEEHATVGSRMRYLIKVPLKAATMIEEEVVRKTEMIKLRVCVSMEWRGMKFELEFLQYRVIYPCESPTNTICSEYRVIHVGGEGRASRPASDPSDVFSDLRAGGSQEPTTTSESVRYAQHQTEDDRLTDQICESN